MTATRIRAGLVGLILLGSGGWATCALGGEGDAACGCVEDCAACPAGWTIRTGIVCLARSSPDDAILVTDSFTPAGAELLDAADHRFGFEIGPDLSVVRQGEPFDLTFRWFQVHDWIATTPGVISPGGAVVQYATPLGNTVLPAEVSSRYLSTLESFELNLERPLNCACWVLAGIRYLQLDEELAILQDIGLGINPTTNTVETANQLLGVQLGARAMLWHCDDLFQIEGFAKAGIYGVDAASQVEVEQTGGLADGTFASDNDVAFVGELGVSVRYRVSCSVSAIAGYQLLWIEGVALAPDQIPLADPISGLAGIDTGGGAFYHGAVLALEVSW
jgi:putative beta barrel porin BBP7